MFPPLAATGQTAITRPLLACLPIAAGSCRRCTWQDALHLLGSRRRTWALQNPDCMTTMDPHRMLFRMMRCTPPSPDTILRYHPTSALLMEKPCCRCCSLDLTTCPTAGTVLRNASCGFSIEALTCTTPCLFVSVHAHASA